MSNIEFLEENKNRITASPSLSGAGAQTGIIGFLISKGIVAKRQQGQVLLILVVIACVALAIIIPRFTSVSESNISREQADAIMKESLERIHNGNQ